MTVILLTSSEKPLLAFARQRLSVFSGRVFLTVPVRKGMKIADVLCELGLKAADAAAELAEGMPGLHAVACGRIVVYAILSSEATPDIASVTAAYDEIWVRKP